MSGLRLFLSSDLDALVDRYVAELAPTSEPLARDTVVVPTSALGQWFEQAVARRTGPGGRDDGVVANVDLLFPSGLLSRVLYDDPARAERWSATALALALLDEEGPAMSMGDALARGAALSTVLVHRADDLGDLLGARGLEREGRLVERRRAAGDLWPSGTFARDGVAHPERAGARVAIVGCLSATAGGLLCDVARALARDRAVDVYLGVAAPDLAQPASTTDPADQPVAERWGEQARAYVEQWRTRAVPDAEVWVEGRATSPALAVLAGATVGDAVEPFLDVHRAVGVARQVEVARDAILQVLATTGVAPHEVRVVTPDAARVAPLLALFFTTDDPDEVAAPRLQYEVGDARVPRPSPRLDAFRALLGVAGADVTVHDVAALLGQPALRAGLGLTQRDVGRLIDLARDGGVSLGVDAASRAALEVFEPDDDSGTWSRFVDRVVAAHLFDVERDEAAPDIATLGVSDDLETVARFHQLVEWLRGASAQITRPVSLATWVETLGQWGSLVARDERGRDAGLDRLLAQLTSLASASTTPLTFSHVRELVEALAARTGGSTLVGRGGVSVLDLVGSSPIPYEVTCVIGLDDEALPESPRRTGEMGEARPTDPDARAEFRAALLDLVASTRRRMIVVTNDRSVVDGSPLATTQPLVELTEALAGHGLVRDVRHPRHGFSRHDPETPGAATTFDPVHEEVARVLASRDASRPDADVALVTLRGTDRSPALTVDAGNIIEYFRRPQRVFLRDTFGAAALHAGRAEEVPDVPRLDLDGALVYWSIRERLLRAAVETGAPVEVPAGPDTPVTAVAAGFRARVAAQLDVGEVADFARDVRSSLASVDAVRDPRGERPAVVAGRHHEIARQPVELYRTSVGPVLLRYTTSTRYASRIVALLVDLAVVTVETGEAVTAVLVRGRTAREATRAPQARPFLSASWASTDPVGDAQRLLGGLLRIYARRFDGLPLHFGATSLAYGARELQLGLATVFDDPATEWSTRDFVTREDRGEAQLPENQLLVPLEYSELLEVLNGAFAAASVDLARVFGALVVRDHSGTTPWTSAVAAMREDS